MSEIEEAYITFCKSHDGNWSARDLFNGGYKAAIASKENKLYTTANRHSFSEVVKDNFGALNVDRCPHCRKQES